VKETLASLRIDEVLVHASTSRAYIRMAITLTTNLKSMKFFYEDCKDIVIYIFFTLQQDVEELTFNIEHIALKNTSYNVNIFMNRC
jgi:hypothetical protein